MANVSNTFCKQQNCGRNLNEALVEKQIIYKFCESVCDGILCWPKTKAGEEHILPCPEYMGFNPKTFATRKCTEIGEWFYHEEFNSTWTNYSQCQRLYDFDTGKEPINVSLKNLPFILYWVPKLKTFNRIGYSLSLTTLVMAILIFSCFQKLQCARNRLHIHLFLSFSLKACLSLLKDYLFIDGAVLPTDVVTYGEDKYVKEHNFWMCKAIYSALQYFLLTNYTLILSEGVYLHNLLFISIISENSDIILYAVFGWGIPICFMTPWIILKIFYDDNLCWTMHKNLYYSLLIHIPIVVSLLINGLLFAKIIYIIFVKLNSMYLRQRKLKYKKLIRSTLILIPLFGIPYIISISTWYPATKNQTIELIWMFFDQIFTSLQGFFVAILYCLINNEVQIELKKYFCSVRRIIPRYRDQSFSLPVYATNRVSLTVEERR